MRYPELLMTSAYTFSLFIHCDPVEAERRGKSRVRRKKKKKKRQTI
jgi:hypothetical protein